jgi:hypothetical protein
MIFLGAERFDPRIMRQTAGLHSRSARMRLGDRGARTSGKSSGKSGAGVHRFRAGRAGERSRGALLRV